MILPYKYYAYPPVRYLLRNNFREELTLPFSPSERLTHGSAYYLTWLEELPSPLLVWLTHDETGQGVAYVTRSAGGLDLDSLNQSISGRRGNVIANGQMVDEALVTQLVLAKKITTTPFVWGGHIHLAGYELTSPIVTAGQAGVITFYWRGLRETDLDYDVFIQILDDQGMPISQSEERIIAEDIQYYENRDGFVAQQHLFWTGPDMSPGLYLLRFGLFDPRTGERLPVTSSTGEFAGDQIILAPFYVSANGVDPRLPDTSLRASLGQTIELLGYSLDQPLNQTVSDQINVKLYWRAAGLVENDYTIFVQLLDGQNQVISQWDSQPLAGLYPTSRWQPGQILVDQFTLSLNGSLTGGSYRLVAGIYDLPTGARLPAFDADGQPWPDDMVILTQITIP